MSAAFSGFIVDEGGIDNGDLRKTIRIQHTAGTLRTVADGGYVMECCMEI